VSVRVGREILWFCALALCCVTACKTRELGSPHPGDAFSYPVAVTADPGGRLIWVTSGNFDLAWRGGAVLAMDVVTHDFVRDAAGNPVGFQIGGFPGPFVIETRPGNPSIRDGYILSRQENALYHVILSGDPDAPEIACEGGVRMNTGILDCPGTEDTDALRLEDPDLDGKLRDVNLGEDPYSVMLHRAAAGQSDDLLLTSAFIDGTAAIFTVKDGAPTLVDSTQLSSGLYAFAENPKTGRIYATSKSSTTIDVLEVRAPDPDAEPVVDSKGVVQDPHPELIRQRSISVPTALLGDTGRGLAFSADGNTLFVAYRSPSSVVMIDVSVGPDGVPVDQVIAKIPVGFRPSAIAVVPAIPGNAEATELVYVTCQGADRVEIIDPAVAQVVGHIRTGQDPFGIAFIDAPDLGLRRLYVANFLAETVGVIELDPASPFYHVEVAELR
jgi:YVTN family beta-propeller protein